MLIRAYSIEVLSVKLMAVHHLENDIRKCVLDIEESLFQYERICQNFQSCQRKAVELAKQIQRCRCMQPENYHVSFPEGTFHGCFVEKVVSRLRQERRILKDNFSELHELSNTIKSECHKVQKLCESKKLEEVTAEPPGGLCLAEVLKCVDDVRLDLIDDYLCKKYTLTLRAEHWNDEFDETCETKKVASFQRFRMLLFFNSPPHRSPALPATNKNVALTPVKASPVPSKSPFLARGNLTGIPRKCKDSCIDLHNAIQKWNSSSIRGLDFINRIISTKAA